MTDSLGIEDPRFIAAIDMIGNTGARSFQIRFQDDEEPTVWIVISEYGLDEHDKPIPNGGRTVYKIAAGLNPVNAVIKLLDDVIDGGICVHCLRPTGASYEIDTMPLNNLICWYQYDPELKKFRRGCE